MPAPVPDAEADVIQYTAPQDDTWDVEKTAGGEFVVRGRGLERLVAMTDMNSEAGVRRLQRILEKAGVVGRLRDMGAADGSQVRIGAVEFDFVD